MEFRLLYSGQVLGASKSDTRAYLKHDIRRVFHPQLRRLWDINSYLDHFARTSPQLRDWLEEHPEDLGCKTDAEIRRMAIEGISRDWERAGYRFVPLVTADLCLRCSLEILFLRSEETRTIVQRGDLDAKLKTVFDALRMPVTVQEAGGVGPEEDETPFYCLLEDDALISEVTVISDQLLVLPEHRQANVHDAFLVIHVKLKPTVRSPRNSYFE